jgi:hypothetical protein
MFGAEEADERAAVPHAGRRWMTIAAAAAGLILVAGIPSIWLLTRSPAPKPDAAAVEMQPASPDASTDVTPAGPPAAPAQRAEGRGAGPGAPAPGTAAPGREGANGAVTPGVKPPDANAAAPPPAAPPAVREGRIAVTAPLPVFIIEKGYQLGVSPGNGISLPAGRHDIELVNESIGYRETRPVDVIAGKTVSIVVNLPPGNVSFNAIPWAEVWADGQKIGETPVANLAMTAGPHEVSFRHPQLGERRLTVVVTVSGPLRVSMDMRKQ